MSNAQRYSPRIHVAGVCVHIHFSMLDIVLSLVRARDFSGRMLVVAIAKHAHTSGSAALRGACKRAVLCATTRSVVPLLCTCLSSPQLASAGSKTFPSISRCGAGNAPHRLRYIGMDGGVRGAIVQRVAPPRLPHPKRRTREQHLMVAAKMRACKERLRNIRLQQRTSAQIVDAVETILNPGLHRAGVYLATRRTPQGSIVLHIKTSKGGHQVRNAISLRSIIDIAFNGVVGNRTAARAASLDVSWVKKIRRCVARGLECAESDTLETVRQWLGSWPTRVRS